MRFRRKVKLIPGVYLNFSKSGISTTIGVPGASLNFGKQGTYLNTGIPGTGLYDRQRVGSKKSSNNIPHLPENFNIPDEQLENAQILQTEDIEATTTKGLLELKDILLNCHNERISLKTEISNMKWSLFGAYFLLIVSYLIIIGFFIKWFRKNKEKINLYLKELETQLENCFVDLDMDIEDTFSENFNALSNCYKDLLSSDRKWDITSTAYNDRVKTRSAASSTITRRKVNFDFKNSDLLKTQFNALHFENANGGDIYIYPAFLAIVDNNKKFGLIDIQEVNLDYREQRFVEEAIVPSDTIILEYTWAKVNKDGSRDKRFKDNHQIPICQYGEIEFQSETGLNEVYQLSCYPKVEQFGKAFKRYKKNLNN